jgi:hypothetical protein
MRIRLIPFALFFVAVSFTVAQTSHAQQEFAADGTPKSSAMEQQETRDGKVVRPSQHSSVVVMMSENGLEIFSPGARPELGKGEKLVTEAIEHDRRIGDGTYDTKPYGGIRLVGWFF